MTGKTYVAVEFKKPEKGGAKWGVIHRSWLAEDLKSTLWPVDPLDPERAARDECLPLRNWPRYKIKDTFLAESGE